ncbi:purine and uridine phosphorylase [Aspergillus desertorum]
MTSLTHDDYTIAWICALPLEMAAARVMLNKTHSPLPKPSADPNAYELGELNGHYIVIACLPAGVYGTISAATVVSRMRSTFPRLQYGLMVGIGGGVPGPNNDIRLGDVVVSKPVGKYSGVMQYDYGKAVQGGAFEVTGTLNKPPQAFLTHMGQLEAKQMIEGKAALSKIVFAPPEQHTDRLFHSSYHHTAREDTCEKCDDTQLIQRQPRETRAPYIHYGLIASGDQVMKDSETRDRLAQQHGILCFEMEAAGLMDELPTLVIRGICDYCNSHKQKQWQGYAALTAAACASLLLSVMPVCRTECKPSERNRLRHWVISLERNPRFVGRQDEITKLEQLLAAQNGPRRVAITGLGGVGKTQLALEAAHRIRNQDKECSVFWVPCTSYAMIEQTFLKIAHILGLREVKPAEVKEQVKLYLSSERQETLQDILPQSEQGHILFTTRNGELAVELTSSNIIHIPDVDKKTAHGILGSLVLQKDLLQDHVTTTSLLEELAYLPLAITQASAYINKKRLGLSLYLTLSRQEERDAVELLSEDYKDPGRYTDIQNPQIQQQNRIAADYLSFMACLSPRNIPSSLLPRLLNAYSFTYNQETQISMHRLVYIATRNWLRKNGLFSLWIQRVADQLRELFPDNSHYNRGLWREYLPHVLVLVHEPEFILQLEQYMGVVQRISDCLASDGRYHEAEVLYSKLMRINREKYGSEHPHTLTSMANLASTYWNQGRWNEAEKLDMQVMETRKTVLGAEHPDTLSSMHNLAYTYNSMGKNTEASELMAQPYPPGYLVFQRCSYGMAKDRP